MPYLLRGDLSKKHKSQESMFEAFWLEIVDSANEKIVASVIYKTPKTKTDTIPKIFAKYTK